MNERPSYILTQDSASQFLRVNDNRELSADFLRACDDYFQALQDTLRAAFPEYVVRGYGETEMRSALSAATRRELLADPEAYAIALDRYLLDDIEREFPDRFFRFSITRTLGGTKIPRAGDAPFREQIARFCQTIPEYGTKTAVIVDDGVFTGGTIRDTLAIFDSFGVSLRTKTIGFMGGDQPSPDREILRPTADLVDWLDIRDVSPLGGKTKKTSAANRVASSVPYVFPWSFGESASLNESPDLFRVSKQVISEFTKLVRTFEATEYKKPLLLRDLVKRGFPLPVSDAGIPIPVSINDRLTDYLARCLEAITYEEDRPVYIFDMDGTLYQLNGANGTFSGSSLETRVRENAIAFIQSRESCSPEEAKTLYEQGLQDPVGLSQFLSQRYNIARSEYFDNVWNIDPSSVIKNFELSVRTLSEIRKNPENKLILLTSAPSVWARRVLATLGVSDSFEFIITGEQFKTKKEVFVRIAGRYRPGRCTSVGDQYATDIEPAMQLGIRGILVAVPADILNAVQPI